MLAKQNTEVAIKALSVRGDFIMDMIAGKKKIEYRTWKTNYRGPILMCSTAKKVAGAAPGYAICVVNLKSIQYFPLEGFYHWNIELANVIKPIHVKGQLKLFNVDDNLIEPISMKEFESEVRPLIYTPRRKKN
ncbi:ASCH domain-containing protein [Peptostreptococcus porci]|uniref:ASCH domain-containing protein n=1 Tax=Peptostreptococcus porci TaxID=2652282 RepID=UPI002A914A96|nr:ASCH domain-containing protein [Peptostreptococcus porci]MDY6231381.1 ASCH domain-containing protein [Peptostreptococcus porci]